MFDLWERVRRLGSHLEVLGEKDHRPALAPSSWMAEKALAELLLGATMPDNHGLSDVISWFGVFVASGALPDGTCGAVPVDASGEQVVRDWVMVEGGRLSVRSGLYDLRDDDEARVFLEALQRRLQRDAEVGLSATDANDRLATHRGTFRGTPTVEELCGLGALIADGDRIVVDVGAGFWRDTHARAAAWVWRSTGDLGRWLARVRVLSEWVDAPAHLTWDEGEALLAAALDMLCAEVEQLGPADEVRASAVHTTRLGMNEAWFFQRLPTWNRANIGACLAWVVQFRRLVPWNATHERPVSLSLLTMVLRHDPEERHRLVEGGTFVPLSRIRALAAASTVSPWLLENLLRGLSRTRPGAIARLSQVAEGAALAWFALRDCIWVEASPHRPQHVLLEIWNEGLVLLKHGITRTGGRDPGPAGRALVVWLLYLVWPRPHGRIDTHEGFRDAAMRALVADDGGSPWLDHFAVPFVEGLAGPMPSQAMRGSELAERIEIALWASARTGNDDARVAAATFAFEALWRSWDAWDGDQLPPRGDWHAAATAMGVDRVPWMPPDCAQRLARAATSPDVASTLSWTGRLRAVVRVLVAIAAGPTHAVQERAFDLLVDLATTHNQDRLGDGRVPLFTGFAETMQPLIPSFCGVLVRMPASQRERVLQAQLAHSIEAPVLLAWLEQLASEGDRRRVRDRIAALDAETLLGQVGWFTELESAAEGALHAEANDLLNAIIARGDRLAVDHAHRPRWEEHRFRLDLARAWGTRDPEAIRALRPTAPGRKGASSSSNAHEWERYKGRRQTYAFFDAMADLLDAPGRAVDKFKAMLHDDPANQAFAINLFVARLEVAEKADESNRGRLALEALHEWEPLSGALGELSWRWRLLAVQNRIRANLLAGVAPWQRLRTMDEPERHDVGIVLLVVQHRGRSEPEMCHELVEAAIAFHGGEGVAPKELVEIRAELSVTPRPLGAAVEITPLVSGGLRSAWLEVIAADAEHQAMILGTTLPYLVVRSALSAGLHLVKRRRSFVREDDGAGFVYADEDVYNDFITSFLETQLTAFGWSAHDQTRSGVSGTGKEAGELDLLLCKGRRPVAVVEAQRCDALNKNGTLDSNYAAQVTRHVEKALDRYDPGVELFLIVQYVQHGRFGDHVAAYRWLLEGWDPAGHARLGPIEVIDRAHPDAANIDGLNGNAKVALFRILRQHSGAGRPKTEFHVLLDVHCTGMDP